MARASIRWLGLLLSFIFSLTLFVSWLSPTSLITAQDVALDLRDRFNDNAAPGGINEKINTYAPVVYEKVQSWWHQFFPKSEELRGLQPETQEAELNPRCKVYTYYDKSSASEDAEALLQVWLKAWWAMGLNPVILTNEDSGKHSLHAALHTKYDGVFKKEVLDSLLAMDHEGGAGFLMAHYVFPMSTIDDPTLRQARQCEPVDVLTRYADSKDDILRGSQSVYKGVIKALASSEAMTDKQRISQAGLAAIPGLSVRALPATKTFARYDPETVATLYPTLFKAKPVAQQGKSFSFGKNQLALLVNGHLQNNFLINHRGGVQALNSKLPIPESDYLSRVSLRIAIELTRCNLTPLPKTCAPQHTASKSKCFDCSQLISSAIVKPVDHYSPKNNTFFVGTVTHPFTTLALDKETVDISPSEVRESQRDIWSKLSLLPALPPRSGAIMGLIFMSENLWKNEDAHLPDAHIWQIFEEDHFDQIEFEVGFTLPELKASLAQLPQSEKEKSKKFQDLLSSSQKIVLDQSAGPVRSLDMVEAWSQYDAGAHQLIRNYLEYKQRWLDQMKARNKASFAVLELA